MSGCVIKSESLLNCVDKPKGGVNKFVQLYNYTDWRSMVDSGAVTFITDTNDPEFGMITDIVNPIGVQAYRFDMPDEAALTLGSTDRLNDGGLDTFDHLVNMSILGTKQAKKNVLLALALEKCVAVVYKKNERGEVYGGEQGLKPTANTYNPNDPNLGSVIPVQMVSDARTPGENYMPADVFKTDAATTKTLIEGLNQIGT
jgi:hypothetical protein